jgi:poly-beta-1,6-N-acetyl-D-glucosamine synthase
MIYLAIACFALLFYSYVGFPLLVSFFATIRPRKWIIDETYRPTVSIILPSFNEERVIRSCLESLAGLNYQRDKLEILCGSDGSTDRTNDILREMSDIYPFIRAFFFPVQRGKMLTLNDLVAHARHEILLFVDADVTLNPNAILNHVRHYADPTVGGVAGCLHIAGDKNNGAFKSESTFLSIESNLRKREAEIFSTVGLYGGNYSIRRNLWKPLPSARVSDDFYAVLTILNSGTRLLYEDGAVSTELYGRGYADEFSRKRRWVPQCLSALRLIPGLLIRGPAAWMLWPHKILRWSTGLLIVGLICSTVITYLNGQNWLFPFLIAEAAGIALVMLGAVTAKARYPLPIAGGLFWFIFMNLAFTVGIIEFIFVRQKPTWNQTTRISQPSSATTTYSEASHP